MVSLVSIAAKACIPCIPQECMEKILEKYKVYDVMEMYTRKLYELFYSKEKARESAQTLNKKTPPQSVFKTNWAVLSFNLSPLFPIDKIYLVHMHPLPIITNDKSIIKKVIKMIKLWNFGGDPDPSPTIETYIRSVK